jgi:hypothetical protein
MKIKEAAQAKERHEPQFPFNLTVPPKIIGILWYAKVNSFFLNNTG